MKTWKCTVCGYIHTGDEPPEFCPVCKADKSKFVLISDSGSHQGGNRQSGHSGQTGKGSASHDASMLTNMLLKLHIHPISTHTPNGVLPMAVLFYALAIALQWSRFEAPAFYSLVFVLLAMPVVLYTGLVEWRRRYQGARTSIFLLKMFCAGIAALSLLILVLWRTFNPGVAAAGSPAAWPFLLLLLLMLVAVGIAGHLGGKLIFDSREGS